MAHNKKFNTRLGVIAATVGSAVGLGNIWRFPYECGQHGGGAFLLAYIVFAVAIGIPVICAEFVIGRSTGKNVAGAFKALRAAPLWRSVGWLGIFTSFLIMGFYSVVAGWCMDYIWQSLTGFGGVATEAAFHERFDEFSSDVWRPLGWTALFLVANFWVISRGVQKGIERISSVLMPLLFIILAVFCVYALTLPAAAEGLEFLLKPDFSQLTPDVLLSALGQAFFSLSVGMGVLITYASYFNRQTPLVRTATVTTALDTLVAVMAGVIIFPACFSFGEAPAAGPRLVFEVLPTVFMSMPLGRLWGALFFILLFVASLTSTLSLTEVTVAYFEGEHKMGRGKATAIDASGVGVMAALSSLSFGPLAGMTVCGLTFFNLLDFVSSNILMPLGGMLLAVYAGWVLDRSIIRHQLTPEGVRRVPAYVPLVVFSLKYLAPVAILAIFVTGLL